MEKRFKSISNSEKKGNGGGCLIIFGIIWLGFSCLFLYFASRTATDQMRLQKEAVKVPCEITKLEISVSKKNDDPFKPDVAFTYEWDNLRRQGDKLSSRDSSSDEYEKLFVKLQQVRDLNQDWCYVDPQNGEAFLLPVKSESSIMLILIPLVSMALGVALLVGGIRFVRETKATAISSKARDEKSKTVGCLFFGVFGLVGIGVACFMWSKAWLDRDVKNWVETDGEVIWSRVVSKKSDDGTTYLVDVFYKDQFEGQTYRSNRYNLAKSSSSGYKKKKQIVDSLPKGKRITCYVNPQEPWRAIVNREYGWGALFLLFPVPFIAVGIGGMIIMLRHSRREFYSDSGEPESRAEKVQALQRRMKRSPSREVKGRWGSVIFLLIFGLIWNGFVLFFLFGIDDSGWFLKLFMIPFVLVGIAVIFGFFYSLIGLFSPYYEMVLADDIEDKGTFPGHEVRVAWHRKGGVGDASRLRIWLVGEEVAIYSRGTDTVTDRSIFYEQVLDDLQAPISHDGDAIVRLPFDLPPSFYGDHNKVRWYLVLAAEVPKRPDFRLEKDLSVLPYTEDDFQ